VRWQMSSHDDEIALDFVEARDSRQQAPVLEIKVLKQP